MLRQKMFLVCLRTMVKNRVRTLLAQHGIEPAPVSDLLGKKGLAYSGRSPSCQTPMGGCFGRM